MPSSGSTTSRIASSRSNIISSSGVAVSLTIDLLDGMGCLSQRILEGHPAQQRALYARRILGDAGESDPVADNVLVPFDCSPRRDHRGERVDGLQRIRDALTDHLLREH